MVRIYLVAAIALLAGCTTATMKPASPAPSAACDAAPAQVQIGAKASQELGAELLRLTGARTLRWLAPGMAATMDFRPDRLTVSYDENQAVVRIACG